MNSACKARIAVACMAGLLTATRGSAQPVQPAPFTGATYTQNFNTLRPSTGGASWAQYTSIPGWFAYTSDFSSDDPGFRDSTMIPVTGYLANNGGTGPQAASGNLFSYGVPSPTPNDRALGSLCDDNSGDRVLGVVLQNVSGVPYGAIGLTYSGEQWRNGGNPAQHKLVFDFQVFQNLPSPGQLSAMNVIGYYSPGGPFDFTGPVATATPGAVDGNTTGKVIINPSMSPMGLPLPWLPNYFLVLRWWDDNDDLNDHGLGIDDLSLNAVPIIIDPPPPCNPPIVTVTPTCQEAFVGNIVYLNCNAAGEPPFIYRWRKGQTYLTNGQTPHGSFINGVNTPGINIINVQMADGGYDYVCEVMNNCPNPPTPSPQAALLVVNTPLDCDSMTVPTSVCAGSTGNTATGPSGMVSYSWTSSGASITSGANSRTVTFTASMTIPTIVLQLTVVPPDLCQSTCYRSIPVNPPLCSITGTTTLCSGRQATYSGPAGMAAYAWSISGSGSIVGPANQQSVTAQAGASGTFTLSLLATDSAACSRNCTGGTVTVNTSSGCCMTNPDCDDDNACTTDTCSSHTCSHGPTNEGGNCNDHNACTQSHACQNGVCVGSNPVSCTASDQCHDAGTCDPATGLCSNPNKPNGTFCTDGELCTAPDTCVNGVCTPGTVTQDCCEITADCDDGNACTVETCVNNECVRTDVNNGTECSDGNACTQTDACQAGTCVGSNPVSCPASDQCHDAGTCNPANGTCSNPQKANGESCNDGNLCTQTDTCQSGGCVGTNPLVCTASDQCHEVGTCNPATGVCTNPEKPDDTLCNDGDACTDPDTCQDGTCVSGTAVVCTAIDQCHDAGVCDTQTGVCSNPAKPNNTGCSDGDPCTAPDTCQNGACTPGGAVAQCCNIDNDCIDTNVCTSDTCVNNECVHTPVNNGTQCSDGDACTQTDACQAGVCVGSNPVTCMASDQCHVAGTCNPATGQCSNPAAPESTACDDANACTQTSACLAGVCTGANPVTCTASDQCHLAGVCTPQTGVCSNPSKPDGTSCIDGNACTDSDVCSGGVCAGTQSTLDTDGDGTLDCNDGCPNDPEKTAPGACGCGIPDTAPPCPVAWVGPSSGTYTDPSNWSSGAVPGVSANVLFNSVIPFVVVGFPVQSTRTAHATEIRRNKVELSMDRPSIYNLNSSDTALSVGVIPGSLAHLRLSGSSLERLNASSGDVNIGATAGTAGILELLGPQVDCETLRLGGASSAGQLYVHPDASGNGLQFDSCIISGMSDARLGPPGPLAILGSGTGVVVHGKMGGAALTLGTTGNPSRSATLRISDTAHVYASDHISPGSGGLKLTGGNVAGQPTQIILNNGFLQTYGAIVGSGTGGNSEIVLSGDTGDWQNYMRDITIGSDGALGRVAVQRGSRLYNESQLIVGDGSPGPGGRLVLSAVGIGSPPRVNTRPSTFHVGQDPSGVSLGQVTIEAGQLDAGEARIGAVFGSKGEVFISNGATFTATGNIFLGAGAASDPRIGKGRLILSNSSIVGVSGPGGIGRGFVNVRRSGRIEGSGRIQAHVNNEGGIVPGLSPGTLTIEGDFEQEAGQLVIEITGADPGQYDVLEVLGTAMLGGELVLDFTGYTPPPGAVTISFLTATGGISGVFDNVTFINPPPGLNDPEQFADGSLELLPCDTGPDTDGDGVKDVCDGCPNDPAKTMPGMCGCGQPETCAPAALRLTLDKSCYKPGDTAVVTLSMEDLPTTAAGFQAFLAYDTSHLTFASWSYTPTPFGLPVINTQSGCGLPDACVNPSPGVVNLAAGINQSGAQTPSSADAALATVTFLVTGTNTCSASNLVTFRPHTPPTRLTNGLGDDMTPLNTHDAPAAAIDGAAPAIICGSDLSVHADAGACTATVTPSASATDNCDASPAVTGARSDNRPLGDPYPQGSTTITWTATDACTNTATCTQTVTVSPYNELMLTASLSGGGYPASLTRCISLELSDGVNPLVTVEAPVTFTSGAATNASVLVPCGSYTCCTIRDRRHTLRRRLTSLPIAAHKYFADFVTPGKPLIGGNLNDDAYVDILDFGVFAQEFGEDYGSGDTTCSTPHPHADLSGDGRVDSPDYTFIQINFLKFGEAACPVNPVQLAAAQPARPVQSISVATLKATGRGDLAVADVNADGMLDQKDMAAWLQGARPGAAGVKPAARR